MPLGCSVLCPVPQVGKTYELLNCDKHKSLLLKNGRDPGEVRPDIAHQVIQDTVLLGLGAEQEPRAASSLPTLPWSLSPPEFTDADGQSPEPGRLAPGVCTHTEERAD